MRETKFRGKRLDNGHWIEGSLCTWADYKDAKHVEIMARNGHRNAVDPKTVGQYTDLKDKNGVEIYEGDVVNLSGSNMRGKGCVVFSEGAFYVDRTGVPYLLLRCAMPEVVEVIGNIYENPGLLKEAT